MATSTTTTTTTVAETTIMSQEKTSNKYTDLEVTTIVFFSIIMVLGILGNSLVVYIYGLKSKKRFLKFERLMLILGVVDLSSTIVNPLTYIYYIVVQRKQWHFGTVGCHFIPAIGPVLTNISLGIILIMAIDRDRAVSTPLKKQFTLNIIYKALGVTIFLSILVYVPYMSLLKIQPNGFCDAKDQGGGSYDKMIVIFLCILIISDSLFLFIFVFTSVRIYLKLKSKSSVNAFSNGSSGQNTEKGTRHERQKETNRIIRLIIAMGILFFICIYPRDLLHICYNMSKIFPPIKLSNRKLIFQMNSYLKILHTGNSVVNVFIYSCMNSHFRKEIMKLLGKSKLTRYCIARIGTNSVELNSTRYSESTALDHKSTIHLTLQNK